MEKREFTQKVFQRAGERGLGACEIYISESESFRVNIFENQIESYNVNSSSGVGFRAVVGKSFGYAYTEKTDMDSLNLVVDKALENARISEEKEFDPDYLIYEGEKDYPPLDNYSHKLSELSDEDKIEMAFTLEGEIYKRSPKIKSIQYCTVGYFSSSSAIINTKGLDLSHRGNGMYLMAVPVADDGGRNNSASTYVISLDPEDFDPCTMAERAVDKVLAYEGAKPCPTGKYRVIIKNEAAHDLLETFSSIFSGKKAQEGMSLLKGKTDQMVARDILTIVDDPMDPRLMGSSPFDSEGVGGIRKNIVEGGRLNTLLYNLETALKEGVQSTGNARRASYASAMDVGASNFYVEKGPVSFDGLVKNSDSHLIITEFQGLHSGANPVSGDFSLAAKGFLVTDGKQGAPVKQITVAGNFYKLLFDIENIGDDLIFGLPSSRGCFGSPSILVKELSIAGV